MKPVHPTRQRVLKNALQIASVQGIQGTTIGTVAKESKLSKSGLFWHFQSKELMQIAILDAAEELFLVNVIAKAKKEPPGLRRLRSLFTGWLGETQRFARRMSFRSCGIRISRSFRVGARKRSWRCRSDGWMSWASRRVWR